MSLWSQVIDLFDSKAVKWGKDQWHWWNSSEEETVCVMGALGMVLQMDLSTLEDLGADFMGAQLDERGRKEVAVFHTVLSEQYPDKECWGIAQDQSRGGVTHLIDEVTKWNDFVCESDEEMLRMVEKTALKLAEEVN